MRGKKARRVATVSLLLLAVTVFLRMLGEKDNLLEVSLFSTRKKKIAMYITTHLSKDHYNYLEHCWPKLLATRPLFKQCDFAMFVTEQNGSKPNMTLISSVFANTGITVYSRANPGYQEGAILAVVEAFTNEWFNEYEWVVRLNPDVLILDDATILENMENPLIDGIFVDCFDKECPNGNNCTERYIHTDFFAVRPKAVVVEDVIRTKNLGSAEVMATEMFRNIIMNGRDTWILGAGPHKGSCRVRGEASPVLHYHGPLHRICQL